MSHQTICDEVMRPLDIDIVDRSVQHYSLHALDDVVAALLREHHHPRPQGGRRGERQGLPFDDLTDVGTETGHPLHGYVEDRTYPPHDLHCRAVVLETRLITPARRAFLRPPHAQPKALQRPASLIVAPDHRDPMHRRPATPVAAERHHHVPATPRVALGHVVWEIRPQSRVIE